MFKVGESIAFVPLSNFEIMAASLSDIEEFLAGPLVKWVSISPVYIMPYIIIFQSSAVDVCEKA